MGSPVVRQTCTARLRPVSARTPRQAHNRWPCRNPCQIGPLSDCVSATKTALTASRSSSRVLTIFAPPRRPPIVHFWQSARPHQTLIPRRLLLLLLVPGLIALAFWAPFALRLLDNPLLS